MHFPMTDFIPQPPDGFRRELIADKKIKSTCLACGHVLTGNILDGHADNEREHLEHCPKSN
jgi:hypothetical protein